MALYCSTGSVLCYATWVILTLHHSIPGSFDKSFIFLEICFCLLVNLLATLQQSMIECSIQWSAFSRCLYSAPVLMPRYVDATLFSPFLNELCLSFDMVCRPMLEEEISPEKHTHKAAEASTSKAAAAAASSKTSGPLTMPVPKTDLSAGMLHAACKHAVMMFAVPRSVSPNCHQAYQVTIIAEWCATLVGIVPLVQNAKKLCLGLSCCCQAKSSQVIRPCKPCTPFFAFCMYCFQPCPRKHACCLGSAWAEQNLH